MNYLFHLLIYFEIFISRAVTVPESAPQFS